MGAKWYLLLGLGVLMTGCASSPPATDQCNPDEPGRPSVVVQVQDAAGKPLAGASVTYSIDGSAFKAATCADGSAPQDCTSFNAGFEKTGTLQVRAEKPGYTTTEQSAEVVMADDLCHVSTQNLKLEMPAVEATCTTDELPSVNASIVDDSGVAVPGATVTWTLNGGASTPAVCADAVADEACTRWVAGIEMTGEIAVHAEKVGYAPADSTVTVGKTADGCHVETQSVQLAMVASKCTGDPAPSVVVSVLDDGTWKAIPGAVVTWKLNGGSSQAAACNENASADQCTSWVVGTDQAGQFEVSASAPGYSASSQVISVAMDEDGCHAVTQVLELRLVSLSQTPSVKVAVHDSLGAPLGGAKVTYSVMGGPLQNAVCVGSTDPDGCTDFIAGFDVGGDFQIFVEKDGFQAADISTSVGWDEITCLVLTQSVDVMLSPSP